MIKLAKDLDLPIEAVTQTFAILAKRGVGKTHTASVMAEEMLKSGQPIIVYDPTGAWFGLKSSKDGKKPAYPVVIFGGEHADIPLEETAGHTIASVIVEKRFPAILDCSLLRKGARIRFMTDFCETLYHKNRQALHLFIDEAQTVAPQNLKAMPEAARLLGAMEDILLQGRRRGLGCTVISPRPAVVNTNIRSACEVIIAMQIIGPHDRKAIAEWVDAHGDDEGKAKKMMSGISSLKKGEAWVWSPSWLNVFQQVKIRDRETFDSSATPTVGGRAVGPARMAEIDVKMLGQEIQQTIEKSKADDPKELRRQIAALHNQVSDLNRKLQERPAEVQRVEVPILADEKIAQLEQLVNSVTEPLKLLGQQVDEIRGQIAGLVTPPAGRPMHKLLAPLHKPKSVGHQTAVSVHKTLAKPHISREIPLSTNGDLPKGERQILTVCAQYNDGADKTQISILTGFKRSSRDAYLARLRSKGFIDTISSGNIIATDEGIAALGEFEPLPTGRELQQYWLDKLPKGEADILNMLIGAYPDGLQREVISEYTDFRKSSRDAYISRLSSRKLVDVVAPGVVRAAEHLF